MGPQTGRRHAAGIAAKRDSPDSAIKVYDKAFQPLWPKPLFDSYFKLLDENYQLRDFEGRARQVFGNEAHRR